MEKYCFWLNISWFFEFLKAVNTNFMVFQYFILNKIKHTQNFVQKKKQNKNKFTLNANDGSMLVSFW